MPVWEDIETKLALLAADKSTTVLRDLVEKMQQWLTVNPRPYADKPELYLTLIEVVEQASARIKMGEPVRDVLQQAGAAGFLQSVEAEQVFQANGNIFQFHINEQIKKLEEPDSHLSIPIVLLVMTEMEASDLESGKAFDNYPSEYGDNFKALLVELENYPWKPLYGATPEDWRPYFDQRTIGTLITEMLKVMRRKNRYAKNLVPEFVDIRTLNDDREQLKKLRDNGCVVIDDVISMRHPQIQHAFRRSLLDAFPKTVVGRIAPMDEAFNIKPPPALFTFSETFADLEFSKRINNDFDESCREVFQQQTFGSWFFNHVPKIIPEDEQLNTGLLSQIYRR